MICIICGQKIYEGFMVWLNDAPAHSPECPPPPPTANGRPLLPSATEPDDEYERRTRG